MRISVFLLCLFGFSMISCSNDFPTESNLSAVEDVITSDFEVNKMINNIQNSFSQGSTRGLESGELIYPDNFGGMYVNEQGELVVLVSEEITENVRSSYVLRAGSDKFIIKSCEYSYNELSEVKSKLDEFFLDENNWKLMDELEWYSLWISDSENRVIVSMDCKQDKIDKFKSLVSNSSLIKFEQSHGKPMGYSTKVIHPAGMVTSTYGSGSVGYVAKKSSGEVGIVTAGHVVPSQGILLSYDGEYLNPATNIQISGKLDAAFVPYDESLFSFSNTTAYGYANLSSTVGRFVEGTKIRCEGSTSKTVKGGTVKNPSTTVRAKIPVGNEEKEVAFSDFIQTSVEVPRGDSGGICYLSSGYNPIGIISCGDNLTYMCKISNINQTFGLSMKQ